MIYHPVAGALGLLILLLCVSAEARFVIGLQLRVIGLQNFNRLKILGYRLKIALLRLKCFARRLKQLPLVMNVRSFWLGHKSGERIAK